MIRAMSADDRLTRMETWMAHQDRLVEQLNDELYRQAQEIESLRTRLHHAVEQLERLRAGAAEKSSDLESGEWQPPEDDPRDRRVHGLDS